MSQLKVDCMDKNLRILIIILEGFPTDWKIFKELSREC